MVLYLFLFEAGYFIKVLIDMLNPLEEHSLGVLNISWLVI